MNNFYAPWCAMNVFGGAESEIKAPNVFFQAHLARPQAPWSIRSGFLPESTAAVSGLWVLLVVGIFLAVACHNGESELSRVDCATNADVWRPYSQMRLSVGGV
jgi:hypothetical protein